MDKKILVVANTSGWAGTRRERCLYTPDGDTVRWKGEGWYAFSVEWNDWRTLPVEVREGESDERAAFETARSMGFGPPRYFTPFDVLTKRRPS